MQEKYTAAEWDLCYKMLRTLCEDPEASTDTQLLKGLITKIYKNARKDRRKQTEVMHRESDRDKLQNTVVFRNGQKEVFSDSDNETVFLPVAQELQQQVQCYACRKYYKELNYYYHRLCNDCAQIHLQKRAQRMNLKGRVAIITGARMKIGYAAALRFLRDGATVIATTRFPADALLSYTQENDYKEWKDRLIIYGLDLKSIPQIEQFIDYVYDRYGHLDMIINNAAQTIAYPHEYFRPVIERGKRLLQTLPEAERKRIAAPGNDIEIVNDKALLAPEYFPQHQFDYFNQPFDARDKNSWVLKMDEVETDELLSVNIVNNIAPFLLNSRFRKLMTQSPFAQRYIINVTSSEGQFSYTQKTIFHPHTNMTKAAMNMMTRTSAADYVTDGILMNSVDVGWVSTGNPIAKKTKLEEGGFIPPLMLEDAVARIYDPIIAAQNDPAVFGKLFKNYEEIQW